MQKPTISTGQGGKWVVTALDGTTAEFNQNKAGEAIAAFNARTAEYDAAVAAASVKADLAFKLDYRQQLQCVGPDGFSKFTGTMADFEWLRKHVATILATADANKAKIAKDYQSRPKALPKGSDLPDKTPIATVHAS